jgi:hypothetical protein
MSNITFFIAGYIAVAVYGGLLAAIISRNNPGNELELVSACSIFWPITLAVLLIAIPVSFIKYFIKYYKIKKDKFREERGN